MNNIAADELEQLVENFKSKYSDSNSKTKSGDAVDAEVLCHI